MGELNKLKPESCRTAADLKRFESQKTKCEREIKKFTGGITDCNGKNACGNPMFMAAVCMEQSCPENFQQYGSSTRRGAIHNWSVVEAPFASWNHIIKQG